MPASATPSVAPVPMTALPQETQVTSQAAGGEWRYGYTNGGNEIMMPIVRMGAGGPAVVNITAAAVPGLSANNQMTARNMLTDLSGSVASIGKAFDVLNATDRTFKGHNLGVLLKLRDLLATEFIAFWKD